MAPPINIKLFWFSRKNPYRLALHSSLAAAGLVLAWVFDIFSCKIKFAKIQLFKNFINSFWIKYLGLGKQSESPEVGKWERRCNREELRAFGDG